MKKNSNIKLILTGLILFIFMSVNSLAQSNWERYENNPVMVGEYGSWYSNVSNPHVFYEAGIFKMWFRGYVGEDFQCGYAESTDGLAWNIYEDTVISVGEPGDWDRYKSIGTILRVDDTLRMWYIGSPNNQSIWAIGYAWSTEDHIWHLNSEPVLEKGAPGSWDQNMVHGNSVYYDGEEYHMWYNGVGADQKDKIGYATSEDGIVWNKDYVNSPVLIPGPPGSFYYTRIMTGSLVVLNDTIYNFFSGYDLPHYDDYHVRIGYAWTTDYIHWTVGNNGDPVLDVGEDGSWDEFYVFLPSVLIHNGHYKMWYEGRDNSLKAKIGLALGVIVDMPEHNYFNKGTINASPNPFAKEVTITYEIPTKLKAKLDIYNYCGQHVSTLINEEKQQGKHKIQYDATKLSSGVYFCVLKTSEGIQTKKIIKLN